PAVRIESGGNADFFILIALGEQLAITVETHTARDVMKGDDPVSDGPLLDTGANVHDRTGNLVAKYLRRPIQAVRDLFHIGPANTGCRNTDQNFAIGYSGHGDFFGHNLPEAPIHSRTHM